MLATRYFVEQLTGRTPVETLRIQAARTERIRLPTRFSGLAGLGVPEAVLAPLTALVADEPDGIRESLLVGVFLLCAVEGYPFRAREGLQKWFIRRGGVSPEDAIAVREAVQVLKAEECFVVQGAGKHGSVTLRDGVVRQSRPANDAFLRSV